MNELFNNMDNLISTFYQDIEDFKEVLKEKGNDLNQ